jgi:ATP-dependent DNA helicase RecG
LQVLAVAPLSVVEIVHALKLKSKTGALKRAVKELLAEGHIEYTIPEKPASRSQKYRLTQKGQEQLALVK